MNVLFFLLFLLFILNLLIFESKKYFHFLRKHTIYSDINNIFKNELKDPLILNGIKTSYKKTLCLTFCNINDILYKEYTLKKFIEKVPHLKYNNSLIYIRDFLIGNGRIFNSYEENFIKSIPKTSNLIIFESENINIIPIKNNQIINKFFILEFPILTKLDLIHYIYDVISFQKYNTNLFLLNWNQYDIDSLNFEKINILLFELNIMFNNNFDFNVIHNRVNNIIESFKY
jgi:hypothetical protein